jgi:hypothetical protein
VIGIGIFLREQDVPAFPSWASQAGEPLRPLALRRVLSECLTREPDNPYVAVFPPLLIDDDDDLRARAPVLWRTLQEAPLDAAVRDILSQVLAFWVSSDFAA